MNIDDLDLNYLMEEMGPPSPFPSYPPSPPFALPFRPEWDPDEHGGQHGTWDDDGAMDGWIRPNYPPPYKFPPDWNPFPYYQIPTL